MSLVSRFGPPTHRLLRATDHLQLLSHVYVASTLVQRTLGLMGQERLAEGEALWIPNCRAIHTCFMRWPMDAAFVDRNMRCIQVLRDIAPFRMAAPVWGAWGVLEMAGGWCSQHPLNAGDTIVLERARPP